MSHLEVFLKSLYAFLTDTDQIENNIVRKHNQKLDVTGDFSFPLDMKNWRKLLANQTDVQTIFDYLSTKKGLVDEDSLITTSYDWNLQIRKCEIVKNNVLLFLNRTNAFTCLVPQVLKEHERYGACDLEIASKINLIIDLNYDSKFALSLTELKLLLIAESTRKLLEFNNCVVDDSQISEGCVDVVFSLKCRDGGNVVKCGAVLNEKKLKNTSSTTEFYRKRADDMRLMAEHKYGLRTTSESGWKEIFDTLGEAAVTIELLQNKPSKNTIISLHDWTLGNTKGASFILYNCARIASIFKKYETLGYPNLPPVENVDFSLLQQAEEWELFFSYVLQFPNTIKNSIKDILNYNVNPHYLILMMSSLCSLFSVYYRKVKILTDRQPHLYPVLYARMYLLKSIHLVLQNSLRIFNIRPVTQM